MVRWHPISHRRGSILQHEGRTSDANACVCTRVRFASSVSPLLSPLSAAKYVSASRSASPSIHPTHPLPALPRQQQLLPPPQPASVDALSAAVAGTPTRCTGGASRPTFTISAAAADVATWATAVAAASATADDDVAAAVAAAVADGGSFCRSTAAAAAAADRRAATRAAEVEALRRAIDGRRALVRKAAAAAAVTVAAWRRAGAREAEADACERRRWQRRRAGPREVPHAAPCVHPTSCPLPIPDPTSSHLNVPQKVVPSRCAHVTAPHNSDEINGPETSGALFDMSESAIRFETFHSCRARLRAALIITTDLAQHKLPALGNNCHPCLAWMDRSYNTHLAVKQACL